MGIVGVAFVFIYFVIKLCSIESFGKPYLLPFVPIDNIGLKNSIIKFNTKKLDKRETYLSSNKIKYKEKD